jgi:hypothetical protein
MAGHCGAHRVEWHLAFDRQWLDQRLLDGGIEFDLLLRVVQDEIEIGGIVLGRRRFECGPIP